MKNIKILFALAFLLMSFNVGVVNVGAAKDDYKDEYQYQNYKDQEGKVYCGGSSSSNAMIQNIPEMFPRTVSTVYLFLQIAVPIALVIFGTIDLIRAITAGKEDAIKNCQMALIRRIIVAVIVFFVFALVKLLINVVADGNKADIIDCMNCFVSNKCKS